MRKITTQIASAFFVKQTMKNGNTQTHSDTVFLHNNPIFRRVTNKQGKESYVFSLAGWNTVTTRERINGVGGFVNSKYRVMQRKHQPVVFNILTREYIAISSREWYSTEDLSTFDMEKYLLSQCSFPPMTVICQRDY